MNLKSFLQNLSGDERDGFARQCGTTRGHLQNVMYGQKACAPELATQIEIHADKAVRRWDLRPDDWHRIWPELIGTEGAPTPEPEKAVANA